MRLIEAMRDEVEIPRGPISIDPKPATIVQNIYIRVAKVDGELYNFEFAPRAVKDAGKTSSDGRSFGARARRHK